MERYEKPNVELIEINLVDAVMWSAGDEGYEELEELED